MKVLSVILVSYLSAGLAQAAGQFVEGARGRGTAFQERGVQGGVDVWGGYGETGQEQDRMEFRRCVQGDDVLTAPGAQGRAAYQEERNVAAQRGGQACELRARRG